MKNLSWLNTAVLFLSCAGQCVSACDNEPSSHSSVVSNAESESEQQLSASKAVLAPLDREILEFIAEFGDVDDEQFDIMLFHGKRDVEKDRRETQKKAIDDEKVSND